MSEGRADQSPDRLRLTVPDAAKALGISPEAVRNRLSRGTLESVKEEGTVYVLIDRDMARHVTDRPHDIPGESEALISEMRGRIEDLREQLEAERRANEENRRIIAALTSRIPEIEAPAPSEPRESPETATGVVVGRTCHRASRPPQSVPGGAGCSGDSACKARPGYRRCFGS